MPRAEAIFHTLVSEKMKIIITLYNRVSERWNGKPYNARYNIMQGITST